MKWPHYRNLRNRPPTPSKSRGPILVRIRRAFIASAEVQRIRALSTPGRPGVRVIAERFGVNPSTVQRMQGPCVWQAPSLTAHQRREALQRLAAGETQLDIGRSYNVDAATIGRLQA